MNRQRILQWLGAAGLVLAMILITIWQHIKIVTMGYEIEAAQQERKKLLQIHQQIRMEFETLSALDRIEQIAIRDLGMMRPQEGQIVLVNKRPPVDPAEEVRIVKRDP
ncbi:MAG TPA: cell division protein FtsL [Nitrospiria bacterium]